jgi:hypothetical protein
MTNHNYKLNTNMKEYLKKEDYLAKKNYDCLKKLTSLSKWKLTMINFVVCFCRGVVGVGNLCYNWAEFFIVL